MFLQANDKVVNLKNVSNINIINDKRIIFNMNYNIEITYFDKTARTEKTKLISDYVYWDAKDSQEMVKNLENIKKFKYFNDNFINQGIGNGFINKNEISSVKFADVKNRVIFNLSHPVTFVDFNGKEKITSEFVYVNCLSLEQFKLYSEYVVDELKL